MLRELMALVCHLCTTSKVHIGKNFGFQVLGLLYLGIVVIPNSFITCMVVIELPRKKRNEKNSLFYAIIAHCRRRKLEMLRTEIISA